VWYGTVRYEEMSVGLLRVRTCNYGGCIPAECGTWYLVPGILVPASPFMFIESCCFLLCEKDPDIPGRLFFSGHTDLVAAQTYVSIIDRCMRVLNQAGRL
jgi:hypothetical protein